MGKDGHTGLRGNCALLWGIVRTRNFRSIGKSMRSAEADGINVDEHFNLMVEMVGVALVRVGAWKTITLRGRLASL